MKYIVTAYNNGWNDIGAYDNIVEAVNMARMARMSGYYADSVIIDDITGEICMEVIDTLDILIY